ncbi:MAG: DUF1064 domain-containing protein [Thermomicrobiales bacterium]
MKKPSKYKAVRTTLDGITFASKREAERYATLKLLEKAGDITKLELQPRYPLVVNDQLVGNYVADFRYRDEQGNTVVEDAKGVKTPVYKLKKKLMKAIYGIEVREV